MLGHIEVKDPASRMLNDNENAKNLERGGYDREEVAGDNGVGMIPDKRGPPLVGARWGANSKSLRFRSLPLLTKASEKRVKSTRTNIRDAQLGLGLSIVKRTAQLLGCALEVDSSPGRGSVFSVTVPKGDGSSVRGRATESEAPPDVVGGRILIVDDEAAVVDATRMLLETEGFEVLTAGSHTEAIVHVSGHGGVPDLLISDYHLREDETGLDVIRAVRDRVRTVVPAILVSGDTIRQSSRTRPGARDFSYEASGYRRAPVAIRTGIHSARRRT